MSGEFALSGRRILVTGANTGIGQAIAVAAAGAGACVIGFSRSAMDETAESIEQAGGVFTAILHDLSDIEGACAKLEEEWSVNGPLDGLVNNAGIIRRANSVDFSVGDWDDVFDVNLKALFFLSQTFARAALSGGRVGKIVNIASLLSFQGGIRVPSYTASKHGVLGVTRILANEWAARGINVNAIAPGYIETNNTEALRNDPARNASILERIPAGRWGAAEDIAQPAVFLMSKAADYIHGAVLPVDGGWLAR